MTFQDLPENWSDLPLTGEILHDVLDLLVTEQARHDGALCVFLCDPSDRLMQPCQIEDLPAGCGLLVAIARRDGLSITADDLRWRDALVRACAGRARAIDVHVVTLHGSRRVPSVGAAA